MKWDKETLKEIIMTDYLDGELSPSDKQAVELAIADDKELQELVQNLQHFESDLQNLPQESVPSHVWDNIQHQIVEDKLADKKSFFQGIAFFLNHHKMASITAVLLMTIITAGITRSVINTRQNQNTNDYYAFLFETVIEDEILIDENVDFGTTIEDYFL